MGFIFCFFREGVVCIFARQALIKLYLRERDDEAGRIACRRRTDHGRNGGGSDRWWLFLSCTYFSPRPSSGGNLFDLRPRRIAFGVPAVAVVEAHERGTQIE